MTKIELDAQVRCRDASIDRRIGKDMIGTVTGFARLSSYHGREALVRLADGRSDWFWLSDLEPVAPTQFAV